ncbi:ceramidase [Dichotomopilus funicola]|uniref:Ceramidase n=1 Tax=Dichotomopilus funicola TaxID=1934379 RepID=A0AAN6UZJ7_9PEZI|nr:ceramidase [Dichotomopilus funicola]
MGHHNIKFSGDPYSDSGVWGASTSRANFCEEDYAVTFYLAEFINALSNYAYIHLALRAIYPPPTKPQPLLTRLLNPKPDFMSLSLLILGIGSFLFHATLRQTLEFVDEFSMLGLTWSMLQASLTARQSPTRARAISIALAVAYFSFSAFYLWSGKIIYQVFAFVGALLGVLARSQWTFHFMRPALPEIESRDWNWRTWKALGWCLVGYGLWSVDLEFCAELRAVKAALGLPWAWGLELHGWWHVLTAVGAAQAMQVAREVREFGERERERAAKDK